MSISNMNVNTVLQISESYLKTVLQREIAFSVDPCLDTQGNVIETGENYLRAKDAVFEFDNISFSYSGTDLFADMEMVKLDGQLEAGNSQNNLSSISRYTFKYPISIAVSSSNNTVLEVNVQLDLPNTPTLSFKLFDIDTLNTQKVTLSLANDPARIKQLSSGTLAIGIRFASASGGNFSDFLNNYNDNELSQSNQHWALILDEWVTNEFVKVVNIDKDREKLRNSDLTLKKITSNKLKIKAKGEYKVVGWKVYCADTKATMALKNAGTSNSKLVVTYKITKATLCNVPTNPNVTGVIPKKDKKDTLLFRSPAHFGDKSDPLGRLYARSVYLESGELILRGDGTQKLPDSPDMDVNVNQLIFAPACSGSTSKQSFSVENRNGSSDRAPLHICNIEFTGRDKSKFKISHGPTKTQIQAGKKQQYRITYTGSTGQSAQAKLRISTNDGVQTIDLRAYLGQGVLSVPNSLTLDAKEEVRDCPPGHSIKKAEGTLMVANNGSGGIEICAIKFVNSSGGHWSYSGLKTGEFIIPGGSQKLTITYRASQLDTWENVELKIHTSGGSQTVNVKGRVRSAEDDGIYPTRVGRIDLAAIGGAETICMGADKLGQMLEVWKDIMDIINGRGDKPDLWGDSEPSCCPEPQQPYCLCRNFMEMEIEGLQEKIAAEISSPNGKVFGKKPPESETFSIVSPYPLKGERNIRIKGDLEAGPVQINIKHWSAMRIGLWKSEEPIYDIAVFDDKVIALAGESLRAFRLQEDGHPEEIWSQELRWSAKGISNLGDLLIGYDMQGHQVLKIGEEGFETMEIGKARNSQIIPATELSTREQRLAFGVGEERIEFLDFTDPVRPDRIWDGETNIEPTSGFFLNKRLVLAGDNGLEVWLIHDGREMSMLSARETGGIISVFGDGYTLYAVTRERQIQTFSVTKKEILRTGEIQFSEDWFELLPLGNPHFIGNDVVMRTEDSHAFNVVRFLLGTIPEREE